MKKRMKTISETEYLEFLDALTRGDKVHCANIAISALNNGVLLQDLYVGLFQKSLHYVGKQWERGRFSIPEEHVATNIVESLIAQLNISNVRSHTGLRAVVTCVDKEFHEVGVKIVANTLEAKGWTVANLGACTPLSELIAFLHDHPVHLAGISVGLSMNLLRFWETISALSKRFPEMLIIAGGNGLDDKAKSELQKSYPAVKYFRNSAEFDEFLESKTDTFLTRTSPQKSSGKISKKR